MDASRFARRLAAVGAAAFAGAAWVAKRMQREVEGARATGRDVRDRTDERVRLTGGRLRGLGYRMQRRQPEPNVTDDVLEARVRSDLGPVTHRLDSRGSASCSRTLDREADRDVEAVLPAELKELWQQPLAGTSG